VIDDVKNFIFIESPLLKKSVSFSTVLHADIIDSCEDIPISTLPVTGEYHIFTKETGGSDMINGREL
jgi:hypothetical protein